MIIRHRYYIGIASLCSITIFFSAFYLRGMDHASRIIQELHDKMDPEPYAGPKYKEKSLVKAPPITDNFPLALTARFAAELPPIPRWSMPPSPHVPERTPLFIGFTRNWRLLQQVVVSYITAGWPPGDIYVIENTGVMDSNKRGLLSLQNPFFLNHTRLEILGVNVIITPTLLTFAQLQNFYLWTATMEKYPVFFWSHMDVVVVPFEMNYVKDNPEIAAQITTPPKDFPYIGFKSVYVLCVEALREVLAAKDEETGRPLKWAQRFFSYDRLALVNVEAFREVGGWDTQIPFYTTDCDMHARLEMERYDIQERPAGMLYDVGGSLEDLLVLYRKRYGPDGTKIPAANFRDPKVEAEELSAIAKGEKELEDAGFDDPENKSYLRSTDPSPLEVSYNQQVNSHKPQVDTGWVEDTLHSQLYQDLIDTMDRMQGSKNSGERNVWQAQQTGGQGEPFYRDSAGFDQAIQITIEHGRHVFSEKWGHRDCDIVKMGLKPMDAWKVVHDGDW